MELFRGFFGKIEFYSVAMAVRANAWQDESCRTVQGVTCPIALTWFIITAEIDFRGFLGDCPRKL